jgi:hypothetical protein
MSDFWAHAVLAAALALLLWAVADAVQFVGEAARGRPACAAAGGVQVKGLGGRAVCVAKIKLN